MANDPFGIMAAFNNLAPAPSTAEKVQIVATTPDVVGRWRAKGTRVGEDGYIGELWLPTKRGDVHLYLRVDLPPGWGELLVHYIQQWVSANSMVQVNGWCPVPLAPPVVLPNGQMIPIYYPPQVGDFGDVLMGILGGIPVVGPLINAIGQGIAGGGSSTPAAPPPPPPPPPAPSNPAGALGGALGGLGALTGGMVQPPPELAGITDLLGQVTAGLSSAGGAAGPLGASALLQRATALASGLGAGLPPGYPEMLRTALRAINAQAATLTGNAQVLNVVRQAVQQVERNSANALRLAMELMQIGRA